MNRVIAGLVLGLGLALGGAAMADPVEGVWRTQPDDNGNTGMIEIKACGAEICGIIGEGVDSAGKKVASANIGKQMIWGMSAKGDGKYAGGKIWAPDRDKTYNGKLTLNGDQLEVQGCVLGICRGQTWTRMN